MNHRDLEGPDRIPVYGSAVRMRIIALVVGLISTIPTLYLAIMNWGDPGVAPAMWVLCALVFLAGVALTSVGASWKLADKIVAWITMRDPTDPKPYRAPFGPHRDSKPRH